MDGVIADDSAVVKGFLRHSGEALGNEASDVVVDIFPFLSEVRHQFLDAQPEEGSRSAW